MLDDSAALDAAPGSQAPIPTTGDFTVLFSDDYRTFTLVYVL